MHSHRLPEGPGTGMCPVIPLSHHHLKRESPNSRSGFFLCLFPGRNYLLMHSQRRLNGIKQIRLVSQPHHIRRMWTVRSNTQLATGMPL
ncbi:hypothetical protein LA635_1937 [Erwinia amylovora LA635]|nr:hypothetical protein LA635_1937 [Erwinia amylovora LA635]CDK22298.1 hypothetical protein LA637_1938 [Erwinia amylovora LA637]